MADDSPVGGLLLSEVKFVLSDGRAKLKQEREYDIMAM